MVERNLTSSIKLITVLWAVIVLSCFKLLLKIIIKSTIRQKVITLKGYTSWNKVNDGETCTLFVKIRILADDVKAFFNLKLELGRR